MEIRSTSFTPSRTPQPPTALAEEINTLRRKLRGEPPSALARRTGAEYVELCPGEGEFRLPYFGAPVHLPFPSLEAFAPAGPAGQDPRPLPLPAQAVLIYHLSNCDGAPVTGRWVSFGDLPDGRMYAQAFQGYSGNKLTQRFGNQVEPLREACRKLGGQPAPQGDASFIFSALPRVPLMVSYWMGEDEFPPTCKILFDASARSHLPIDVCAILGSMLVGKILKAAG